MTDHQPTARPLIILPDPLLRQRAKPLPRVDDQARRIFDDMLATMKAANGIGLAAPQIGILQQLVVIDFSYSNRYPEDDLHPEGDETENNASPAALVTLEQWQEEERQEEERQPATRHDDPRTANDHGFMAPPQTLFLANPEIVWRSDEPSKYQEGCLSIPGVFENVTRPKQVKVRYWDYDGKEQEIAADRLLATCLQHEVDHLQGRLFIDYLSLLKRSIIVRKFTKQEKKQGSISF